MPRKILVAFAIMGTLALLMCSVLIYFGKGKWVALIIAFHALIVLLWYSIRAVRPHQADIPSGPDSYQVATATSPVVSDKALDRDWVSEPPPAQRQQGIGNRDDEAKKPEPASKDWTLQPPPIQT